jgi:hypothetical protein
MNYSLLHLSDGALLRDLAALVSKDRATTSALLAHLAEVDARKLYLPAAYPSMYIYCVRELHMSEAEALRRITVARTARLYPVIFERIAAGRVHLSAVNLLAPYLTPASANELLAAADYKTKAELEQWLATRFPKTDLLPLAVESPARPRDAFIPGGIRASESSDQLVPGRVGMTGPEQFAATDDASRDGLVPGRVAPTPDGRAQTAGTARMTPLSGQSVALQVTLERSTYDLLCHVQRLLSHTVSTGDIPQVLDRALRVLARELEKRKFAATDNPRPARRQAARGERFVPAAVKRTVWQRDGGRCTFVSDSGHRCPARSRLEFDHIEPVARGGRATVESIRLRCRAHNQYEAERVFGAGFMHQKRRDETDARARARTDSRPMPPTTQAARGSRSSATAAS